jgi:hypothetical protein
LNPYEIQSLIFFKRKYKKQLSQAVTWLAEIGEYMEPRAAGVHRDPSPFVVVWSIFDLEL